MHEELHKLIIAENRRIVGEAVITLGVGVGVGVCVIVYGVLLWLSWFVFTMCLASIRIGSALTSALIVTSLFVLASIWSAWRRHDPMENVQGMDPKLQGLQLGLGYALGVPVVNRQSLAGIASLFIGGPANLMDAWAIFRTRIKADSACVHSAAQLLEQSSSVDGVSSRMIRDPRAAGVLYRLGLIKAAAWSGPDLIVHPTIKGSELLAASAHRSRAADTSL